MRRNFYFVKKLFLCQTLIPTEIVVINFITFLFNRIL